VVDTDKRVGKQRGRPFPKGQSGNPRGRPEGSRNRATIMAQTLLDDEAEALTRKVIDLAMEGDTVCLRVCLERLVPPRKDSPITVSLPKVEGVIDLPRVTQALLLAVATGKLTPAEAQALTGILEVHRKNLELVDLEERLSALEAITAEKGIK
jgi:hypothetical protein